MVVVMMMVTVGRDDDDARRGVVMMVVMVMPHDNSDLRELDFVRRLVGKPCIIGL